MSVTYDRYLSLPTGPMTSDWMMSAKPMMALSGVRSSWLIVARNADLARLALSASSLAWSTASAAAYRLRNSSTSPNPRMETADSASMVTRRESPSIPVSQMTEIRTPTAAATNNRMEAASSGTARRPVRQISRRQETCIGVSDQNLKSSS